MLASMATYTQISVFCCCSGKFLVAAQKCGTLRAFRNGAAVDKASAAMPSYMFTASIFKLCYNGYDSSCSA